MLIAFRALQGIGGATIFATSLALLAQTFHGKSRGVAFGVWGAVVSLSTAMGPLLGGLLTTGVGWRWIFFVNVPIGVLAVFVTLRYVQESKPPQARRIDFAGFAVFTGGLVALVYGLIRANEHGWTNTVSIVAWALAAILLAAFPLVERAVKQPMFDFSLFRKPTFVGGSIAAFAMNGSLFAMLLYFTLYLQEVLGYSALQTGLRLAIITGATLFTAIPAGRLSSQVPVRWLIGPGLLMVGAGLLLMRGLDAGSDWTHLIPGFLVAGLGSGLVNPPLASTAVGVVEPRQAGMASGINSTFRQVRDRDQRRRPRLDPRHPHRRHDRRRGPQRLRQRAERAAADRRGAGPGRRRRRDRPDPEQGLRRQRAGSGRLRRRPGGERERPPRVGAGSGLVRSSFGPRAGLGSAVAQGDQGADGLAHLHDRSGAHRLLEFAVDPVARRPADVGRLATALGQLERQPTPILRVGAALDVAADHQRVDQFARRLLGDAEVLGDVADAAHRPAVASDPAEQPRPQLGDVVEPRLGVPLTDRLPIGHPPRPKQHRQDQLLVPALVALVNHLALSCRRQGRVPST